MPTASSSIRDYYFKNFDSLPVDKQFHFISRLSMWDKDVRAIKLLSAYRLKFVSTSIENDLRQLIQLPSSTKVNAATRRAPYFKAYPTLHGTMLALFRVRHLLFHYDLDARETLLKVIPKEDLYALSDALINDKEAIASLSTYAINTIYLIESILYPRNNSSFLNLNRMVLEIGDTYSESKEDLLLLTYLYTHCIIGASNFYQTSVNDQAYTIMLAQLDDKISRHFNDMSLDSKCEFLVCCKLIGFESTHKHRINHEAIRSVSKDGTFIVDKENSAKLDGKKSFSSSEHRNVLYIMSQSTFQHRM